MNMRRHALLHGVFTGASAALFSSLTLIPDALAQEQAKGLGDIVVTAQRVEQNLQKTPLSVATVSASDLSARGAVDPAALQGQIPAVQIQPIGDVLVSIRGIGTFNLQPGADAAIAYNIDDVYIAHATGITPVFFDMQRIEALRGPQGTLYGRNTNAGAINVITNKPELGAVSAAGQVQFGNYDLIASEAMLNLPLGDKLAVRVSGATQNHDGYLRDGHNDADLYAGRVRLLAEPTDDVSVLLTADYSKQSGVGAGGSSPCPANFATAGCSTKAWDAYAGNETPVPDDFRSVKNLGLYGHLTWDFGGAVLTSITSWRRVKAASLTTTGDAPLNDFGYFPSNTDRLFTQELRLNSAKGSPIQWVAGAYYSREKLRNRIDKTFVGNTFLGVSEVLDPYRATSKALFAQATVPLTEGLRVTGGLRYTDEKKSASGSATNFLGLFFGLPIVTLPTGGRESHSRLTWKVGAEADLAPTSMVYANVSTGFKSGGVNQSPGFGIPTSYGPERITAFQLGSKNRFLDNRLQINAEFFYYRYKGFQDLLTNRTPGYFVFFTANSQKARTYGGEIEALAQITPNDRLDASLALLNTRFLDYDLTSIGGANFSGNEMRNSPKATFNAGYQHRFELGGAGSLTARAETQIVSRYFADTSNAIASRQKSYMQSNASLRYESGDGRWGVTGWVRNLEDKTVMYSYFGGRGWPQAPRTYGVTLQARID